MMKIYEIIEAEPLQIELCEAMGLNPGTVASMTVHLDPGEPVKVYVTLLAEKKILDVDLSAFSKAVEVKEVKE